MDSGAIQMPPALGPEPPLWRDLVALPWRRYEIFSHLAPAEVVAAMRNATEPRRWFRRPFRAVQGFEGIVAEDSFLVNRVIGYQNWFLPFVKGRIEAAPGGTKILISMRPHLVALVSMAAFMSGLIAMMFLPVLFHRGFQYAVALPCSLAIACGYLFFSAAFGLEARWVREMLHKLLLPSGAQISSISRVVDPAARNLFRY
ncbi:MAG TPA: hypothetical protein VIX59_19060 [Candidatus Binataceae bacterium]